jgi:hypothetical protein
MSDAPASYIQDLLSDSNWKSMYDTLDGYSRDVREIEARLNANHIWAETWIKVNREPGFCAEVGLTYDYVALGWGRTETDQDFRIRLSYREGTTNSTYYGRTWSECSLAERLRYGPWLDYLTDTVLRRAHVPFAPPLEPF